MHDEAVISHPESPLVSNLSLSVIERLRTEYLAARPWPHVVMHDQFAEDLLRKVTAEVRDIDRSKMRGSRSRRHVKRETNDPDLLGPATLRLQDFLDSTQFIDFLVGVTGVTGLQADETHYAAGVHETPTGGKTMVHTDFAMQPETRLHHRVNVLLYLNPGWQDDWGGQLELWPTDMSACGRRIQPTMNTMVIWETHAGTAHGLPEPVSGPPGNSRFAIAAYFYTTEGRDSSSGRGSLATYAARPGDSRWTGVPLPRDLARALLPARLQVALWRTLERIRTTRTS